MPHRLMAGLLAAILAGCHGEGSSSDAGMGATSTTTASAAPVIGGSPRTSVVAGQRYSFSPTLEASDQSAPLFNIENAPSWASFNTATGQLLGTPSAADVGTFADIVIGVTDGGSAATLPAFAITVTETAGGTATLSWEAPTENTNGTALTDLSGYVLNYGTSVDAMVQAVTVNNPGILTYVLSNLSPGTWYFSVTAYAADDRKSAPSPVVSWTFD